MLAVIKTGGKQYLVSPEQKIKIEKIEGEEGKEVEFGEVLLLEKNKQLIIGAPFVEKAKVIGKILKQAKGPKLIVFKYKPKKRFRRKKGHRQLFTEVEILKIENKDE
ncbi:MAG: 50S ribosomal protein L21 [bacterium]|nr:50S ribosomal protein L21 [bacterium]